MKITSIAAQVKTPGRFSIFIEGKYAFSLSDTALFEHKLTLGQDVSQQQVTELKQVSNDDKLYGLVLRYVGLRPRSEWEIRTYLQRKQASPALVVKTLSKLSKSGLIDDVAFTRAWVENRILLRPTSKRKLQQELRAKHVADEVIGQVLASDGTDERQILRTLVAKKRTKYTEDIKLMQYLARQGFSYEDIKAVVREKAQ